MTLQELVDQSKTFLEAHPEAANIKVITEGCDCYGDADKIVPDKDGEVLILRTEDGPSKWHG
jgi:hypothetical protein